MQHSCFLSYQTLLLNVAQPQVWIEEEWVKALVELAVFVSEVVIERS
jgi:hypothetical protein